MKIVAVDAYTLNSGDLSWKDIQSLGELELHDRSTPSEVVERCQNAEIILTNKVAFGKELFEQLPKLRLIAVTATGYNIVDIEAAKNRNVIVCNVPDYGTDSVAQHTFALILELANRVGQHSASVRKGDWVKSKDFSFALTPLIELKNKTLGLVGFGNIGKKTAEIARVFGMQVIYNTPSNKQVSVADYRQLDEVFRESDFVSLHLPLKPDNREFVKSELLLQMKASAFLINTSRGQLIHEQDLANALNANRIAGAALDVLSNEPPLATNPLLEAKNCIITPHNAWMSKEARERIMNITLQNIQAYLNGKPTNKVN